MLKRHSRFLLAVCLAAQAVPMAFGQQQATHPFATTAEAFSAFDHAHDEKGKGVILFQMRGLPLETPDQFTTIYDFVAGLEKKTTSANENSHLALTQIASGIFDRVNDPRFGNAIATALGKELHSLPPHFIGQYGARTASQLVRFQTRELRLKALTGAAGRTKAIQALPILQRMLKNDGIARDAAASAIGEIGDPTALEDMIKRIERDPKSGISLLSFGPTAFDRTMREINDPTVSEDAKSLFRSELRYWLTPENKNKYIELLDHPDPRVREFVGEALCGAAKSGDEGMVLKLAHDPTWGTVRLSAVGAMGTIWTDGFLPTATDMLLHDKSPIVRGAVAIMLGKEKIIGAVPALKSALSDRDAYVRERANEAIESIETKVELTLIVRPSAFHPGKTIQYRLRIKNIGSSDLAFKENSLKPLLSFPDGRQTIVITPNPPRPLVNVRPGELIMLPANNPTAGDYSELDIPYEIKPGRYGISTIYQPDIHKEPLAVSNRVDFEITP